MGVDIEPGCKENDRCYSVVVVEDGSIVAKYENVSLHRLVRLIWEYRPDTIAVDNIMELAESEHELAKVVSMLPLDTSLVQVTRLPDGSFVDLRRLAKIAGIDIGQGKLTPVRTAYVAALLALKGYGSHVRFVEEKTKIIISRSRRLKHGGMSNPRFQRRVRAAILRAMKDVKKILDRHKFDYDLMIRKSGGGLDSAVFIVYASREALRGLVKPYEDNDVRIEIKPIYSGKIYFESTEKSITEPKPYIIVGVDPGISTAIAVIDIHGRFIDAISRRGFDRSEAIEYITRLGIPILVATDVRPAPDFVKKLAANLGVPVFEPPTTLTVEEKRVIFESYIQKYPVLRKIADSHIRDALAAALKAYQSYEPKLRQVESYASRIDLEIDVDSIKAEVIKGATIAEAVEKAINKLLSGVTPNTYLIRRVRRDELKQSSDSVSREKIEKLHSELERLKAENKALRSKISEMAETVKRMENEYRLLRLEFNAAMERDRQLAMLSNEVTVLRNELEKARQRISELEKTLESYTENLFLVSKGLAVPVLLIRELNSDSFGELRAFAETYGKLIVKIDTINPVQWKLYGNELRKLVLAILTPRSKIEYHREIVEEDFIPVLPAEKYIMVELSDKLGIADSKLIIDAYDRLEEIKARKARERESKLDKNKLRRLIEEYRSIRAKLLLGLEDSDFTLDKHPS